MIILAHLPALAELSKNNDTPFELKAVYSRSEASALSLATSAQKALSLPNGPDVYFDVAADGKSSAAAVALDALLKRKDIKGVIIVLPITHQPQVVRAAYVSST
jgi:predicted dehydrogenase